MTVEIGAGHIDVFAAILELGPGPWWIAHEHPERPPDDWVLWSWDCDACIMHLVAAVAADPDERAETVTEPYSRRFTTKAGTLAEAREWRAEHGRRAL